VLFKSVSPSILNFKFLSSVEKELGKHGGNPLADEPEHIGRGCICTNQGELRIPTVSDKGDGERLRRNDPAGACAQYLTAARKDTERCGGTSSHATERRGIRQGT